MKDTIKEMIESWGIANRIVAITTDNAANIKNAVKLLNEEFYIEKPLIRIPCFAHTLNLVVQNSIIRISDTVRKVKSIVELFHISPGALEKLRERQSQFNEPYIIPRNDCITRWNSTFDMLESIVRIKSSLIATLTYSYPKYTLTEGDMKIMENTVMVLMLFKRITEILSGDSYITSSQVIVHIDQLQTHCNTMLTLDLPASVKHLTRSLAQEISIRFGKLENQDEFSFATILDPRFKTHGFNNKHAAKEAIRKIKELILSDNDSHHNPGMGPSIIVENRGLPNAKKDHDGWSYFDAKVKDLKCDPNAKSSCQELLHYLSIPLLERDDDPLKWWESNKHIYPSLIQYVRKYHCIVASSVPSERVFSKAGQMIVPKRNQIGGAQLNKILFLNMNF